MKRMNVTVAQLGLHIKKQLEEIKKLELKGYSFDSLREVLERDIGKYFKTFSQVAELPESYKPLVDSRFKSNSSLKKGEKALDQITAFVLYMHLKQVARSKV